MSYTLPPETYNDAAREVANAIDRQILARLDAMGTEPLFAVDMNLVPRGFKLSCLPGRAVPVLGPNAIQVIQSANDDAIGCVAGWISDES